MIYLDPYIYFFFFLYIIYSKKQKTFLKANKTLKGVDGHYLYEIFLISH